MTYQELIANVERAQQASYKAREHLSKAADAASQRCWDHQNATNALANFVRDAAVNAFAAAPALRPIPPCPHYAAGCLKRCCLQCNPVTPTKGPAR